MGETRRINLNEAQYKLGGDDLDIKTATAMALIDIAESLRDIHDVMPSRWD